MDNQYVKNARRSATIGLIGTGIGVSVALLWHFVGSYEFRPNAYTMSWLLSICSGVAIATVLLVLNMVRKQIPKLRQEDDLTKKLRLYASAMKTIHIPLMLVALIECAVVVLSNEMALLMIVLLVLLMQVFTYPNMLKVKVDLGLNDKQMKSIFGDKYVA